MRVNSRVRAWAARFTDDDDAADDVAQDVLISLDRRVAASEARAASLPGCSPSPATWRSAAAPRAVAAPSLLERHATLTVVTSEEPVDPDAARIAALVLEYFDALPRRQRQIFERADIFGMSPADIARELGMQQVTVRAHLFKARRTIRERMLANHERLLKEYTS